MVPNHLARLLSLTFVAAGLSWAQLSNGSIVGTVNDPSGLPVSGAVVNALHVDNGQTRETTTNERGDFVLTTLEPGQYKVTIAANGFKKKELDNVILTTGATLPVGTVKLDVGGVTETVQVTAQGEAVMTRSSERSDLVSSKQIDELVVRGRAFTDLTELVPGIVNTSKSQDISSNPSIYVMGNRNTFNSVFVDGIPANDMGNGFQMKTQISQDAVSEVKVETSNYQAEYGRGAGSNIIAASKSGTKDFHGMVNYFSRNEDYNANNFFNNLNGIKRPRYRYNTVTYNIGGPLTIPKVFNKNRDKLFFFWNQEFWPEQNSSTGSVTVPSALERQGNFSQSFQPNGSLYVVKDPTTGMAFPGNTIPTSRLDPNGLALLNMFPLPNFTNTAISKGNYNYVFASPLSTPLETDTGRVDYLLNTRDTISGTYHGYSDQNTGSVGIADAGSLNWPLMVKTWSSPSNATSARWTHIFTPNLLNEASFGFLDQPANDTYTDDQLQKIVRSAVGFKIGMFNTGGNPLNVIPDATFGGVPSAANLEVEPRFPLYNRYYLYNWSDTLSYTHGSHTIKTGIYLERFTRNQKKLVGTPNGSFDFQNNANNPLNTGYAYANATLGNFYSYTETSSQGWTNLLDWDIEAFIQDNWKVNKKLTLDYGVRLYHVTPFIDQTNMISGFIAGAYNPAQAVQLIKPGTANGTRVGIDPVTGTTYPAADIGAISPNAGNPYDGIVTSANPGNYPRSLSPGAGVQLGPRFGFAYDVFGDGKMAVRGGFGLFYNRFNETPLFDSFAGQPPGTVSPIVYYGQLPTLLSSKGLLFPQAIYGPDTAGNLPRVMNYSLSVQRDVGFHTIVDVSYAASLARHLAWWVDQNAIPIGADFMSANQDPTSPGKPLNASFYRPTIGYTSIYQYSNGSSSNYNSLQVSAQRRFANNFQFGLAWTWSKALDYNDTDNDTITNLVPRSYYYSLATFDRPQVLTLNYIYDLPKTRFRNPIVKGILNDWELSGITSFQSGAPLGVSVTTTTGEDITGTPTVTPRAVVTANPNLSSGSQTFSHYFNTAAIALPAVGTYGNAPRLFIRGPGINDWDLALVKNLRFHDRLNVQLRWEAYNAFNHTQYSTINTTALFNPATGAQTNPQFGAVTAARDPRQLQMAARITF